MMNELVNRMREMLKTFEARRYPVAVVANALASDYLRKMGVLEREAVVPMVEREFPAVWAEVKRAYAHHI